MDDTAARQPIVFVVDDEEPNLFILQATFKAQPYKVRTFNSGQSLLEHLESCVDKPDILLLDVMMPGMDGYEVCRRLRSMAPYSRLPIVMVTGLDNVEHRVAGLDSGADDYITKPFHPMEVRARVRSLLRLKFQGDELEDKNLLLADRTVHLEATVRERTKELEDTTLGVVAALEKANELNDTDTGRHLLRVCSYSELLANGLDLPGYQVNSIRRYASLHDVGKVGLPDQLLKKPGPLTQIEFEEMKKHTVMGYELLRLARADTLALNIALCHHEKYNGRGYPYGLTAEQIPVEARIVALADVFDALTTRRCYKNAYPLEQARQIIEEERGHHFDPKLVDIHLENWDLVVGILDRYQDTNVDSALGAVSQGVLNEVLPPKPVSPILPAVENNSM